MAADKFNAIAPSSARPDTTAFVCVVRVMRVTAR
jgi:hypothetical protein